jgi:hypothetical protein
MSVRDLHPRRESKKLIVLKMRWACGELLDTNLGVRIYANTIPISAPEDDWDDRNALYAM